MANSSGVVDRSTFTVDLAPAAFFHAPSGVQYRILNKGESYWFHFTRDALNRGPAIAGERRFDFFVGSGSVGRSFLYSSGGFLFQAPVSYYSRRRQWGASPGYESHTRMNLIRAVGPECLECHASQLQPVRGTQNGFANIPFLENGVSCERCHGPAQPHVSRITAGQTSGDTGIVNPARLEPGRRDSVCAQCHLTGEARIFRAGRSLSTFRPGDLLSDHVSSFVWSTTASEMKATSHFEKLWQSRCKKESGDRLWCGTCHDPHFVPAEKSRAEYFRAKCLTCHRETDCRLSSALRAANQDDCAACHMPKTPVIDAGHTVYTDHSIPVRPRANLTEPSVGKLQLQSFWGNRVDTRALGLAYAEAASQLKKDALYDRAFDLLRKAAIEEAPDAQVLLQLGFIYDRRGQEKEAEAHYRRCLEQDPSQTVAAVNLGGMLAKKGQYPEALKLWKDALSRNPGLETGRIFAAVAYLRSGKRHEAREQLMEALRYNPDSQSAQDMLAGLK
jgi:TPR repeat protein